MKLYHGTMIEDAATIKKEGLVPMCGARSQMCSETSKHVFLCQAKDVPYWQKILGTNALFSVNVDDLDADSLGDYVDFGLYGEYRYVKAIPPAVLSREPMPEPLSKQKEAELCLGYIHDLHLICREFAAYYLSPRCNERNREAFRNYLKSIVFPVFYSVQMLDFSTVPAAVIREAIRGYGDGHCPFTDRCTVNRSWWNGKAIPPHVERFAKLSEQNDERRLYQMLRLYPKDEFTDVRKGLYHFIVKTFRPTRCLYLDTGSFWAI